MAKAVTDVVRIYDDAEAMSRAAAEGLAALVQEVLATHATVSLAACGGSTPRRFYEILSTDFAKAVPWKQVELFWGDERYVSQRDRRSNFRMLHEALLRNVEVPLFSIFPMPTHRKNPDDAADDYESFLRSRSKHERPSFDVVLLGLGADGHTASLFPGSPALDEKERWVVSVRAPVDPPVRLTLTLPVINSARHVWFLVTGSAKADALARVLAPGADAKALPASAVRPAGGEATWWIDGEAAAHLLRKVPTRVRIEDRRTQGGGS